MKFLMSILKKAKGKVTVALSGGSDSVAIAHFLKTKYPKIDLQCFHFHHNLREQNDLMLEKCISFCTDFSIPLSFSVREKSGEESEAALRKARYDAMNGLGYVITGHHLNDAVENYLYNCFNGVPEYLPIPLETEYEENDLIIIRPFILSEKRNIRDYINKNNLEKYIVEDETNNEQKYRRNWLRNSLVPQINNNGYNLETVVRKRYMNYLKQKSE